MWFNEYRRKGKTSVNGWANFHFFFTPSPFTIDFEHISTLPNHLKYPSGV